MFNNIKWFGKVFNTNITMTVGVNLLSKMCILYYMSTLVFLKIFI